MSYYDLSKAERKTLSGRIARDCKTAFLSGKILHLQKHFSNVDTYIRKAAYLSVGKIFTSEKLLHQKIIGLLQILFLAEDEKIRQTVINAAGEIGKSEFGTVKLFFDKGLFDSHHSVRNAVIGSVKKMGEVNPKPVLKWATVYLKHPDKEIRREICHGIELRGRKHPEDILPILKQLEFDKTARVKNTLVHVIGQISYKKGCLEKVIADLKTWKNHELVAEAIEEIIDVHHRYKDFAALSQSEAKKYIDLHFQ